MHIDPLGFILENKRAEMIVKTPIGASAKPGSLRSRMGVATPCLAGHRLMRPKGLGFARSKR